MFLSTVSIQNLVHSIFSNKENRKFKDPGDIWLRSFTFRILHYPVRISLVILYGWKSVSPLSLSYTFSSLWNVMFFDPCTSTLPNPTPHHSHSGIFSYVIDHYYDQNAGSLSEWRSTSCKKPTFTSLYICNKFFSEPVFTNSNFWTNYHFIDL